MNAFWKGLVASVAVYQLVLSYCMLDMFAYFVWLMHPDHPASWGDLGNTAPTRDASVTLVLTLIVLVVFNLLMLRRSTRPSQDS